MRKLFTTVPFLCLLTSLVLSGEIESPSIAPSIAQINTNPYAKRYMDYHNRFAIAKGKGKGKTVFFFCNPVLVMVIRKRADRYSIAFVMDMVDDRIDARKGITENQWIELDTEIALMFLDLWRKWGKTAKYPDDGEGKEAPLRSPFFFSVASEDEKRYFEGTTQAEKDGRFSKRIVDFTSVRLRLTGSDATN